VLIEMGYTEQEVAELVEDYFALAEQYKEQRRTLEAVERRLSAVLGRLYEDCSIEQAREVFDFLQNKLKEEQGEERRKGYLYLAMAVKDWIETHGAPPGS
jgi:hypothetical protein